MTALQKYQRIEATGLWRATPEEQRREVIVSIGDATLVISDTQDRALTHWSLPAVERANPGQSPALYHPDGDPGETLELGADETDMMAAIEKLRSAIDRQRPKPGRLRLVMMAASISSVLAVGVFWLPGAMVDHAVSVVPPVKRLEIGQRLLGHLHRVSGPACQAPQSLPALKRLSQRLRPADQSAPATARPPLQLTVVRSAMPQTVMLPGGILVLNAALFEDYEEPDVAAGFIIAEDLRAQARDPLDRVLRDSGLFTSFKLLTTGTLPDQVLRDHIETLLSQPADPLPPNLLLQGFRQAGVKSSPYAYALDVSGEETLPLIEADPFPAQAPSPVLSDNDWVRLQSICEG